jgi:hypothetical protein
MPLLDSIIALGTAAYNISGVSLGLQHCMCAIPYGVSEGVDGPSLATRYACCPLLLRNGWRTFRECRRR